MPTISLVWSWPNRYQGFNMIWIYYSGGFSAISVGASHLKSVAQYMLGVPQIIKLKFGELKKELNKYGFLIQGNKNEIQKLLKAEIIHEVPMV